MNARVINIKSIHDFEVYPENTANLNKENLQKAIDWASEKGAALFVEPSDEPYPIDGGIILKKKLINRSSWSKTARNGSPIKKTAGGTVFAITDRKHVFITVQTSSQIK